MPKISTNNSRYERFFLQRTIVLRTSKNLQQDTLEKQPFNDKLQDFISIYRQDPKIANKFVSFLDEWSEIDCNKLQSELNKEIRLMAENCDFLSGSFNKFLEDDLKFYLSLLFFFTMYHTINNDDLSKSDKCLHGVMIIILINGFAKLLRSFKTESTENAWDYIDTPTTPQSVNEFQRQAILRWLNEKSVNPSPLSLNKLKLDEPLDVSSLANLSTFKTDEVNDEISDEIMADSAFGRGFNTFKKKYSRI